jgi:hypothetical protein
MKYTCIIFILLVVNTYATPSGHCELSSDRCIEEDFLPVQGSRNCTTGTDNVNTTYKTCGVLEVCKGPSEDYASKFLCNYVTDADASSSVRGAIEKACISWKNNTFCEFDTDLLIWMIIGIIVVSAVVGFVIYYFMAKKAAADEDDMMAAGARKGKYRRFKNKRSGLYKFSA